MNRAVILTIFVVVALLQLAAPGYTIWRQERTLALGQPFKFRTEPVDPYDAFRGRFVALGFRDAYPRSLDDVTPEAGEIVYTSLGVDVDGFAVLDAASASPPQDRPYLKTRWAFDGRLILPFDRFYLDEFKASDAERAYRENARNDSAWLVVRVLDGNWAIEDLYLDGRRLQDVLAVPVR